MTEPGSGGKHSQRSQHTHTEIVQLKHVPIFDQNGKRLGVLELALTIDDYSRCIKSWKSRVISDGDQEGGSRKAYDVRLRPHCTDSVTKGYSLAQISSVRRE